MSLLEFPRDNSDGARSALNRGLFEVLQKRCSLL